MISPVRRRLDDDDKVLKLLAVPARLELATFGLGNRCSIRLSYGTVEIPQNGTEHLARPRPRFQGAFLSTVTFLQPFPPRFPL
jgi:hypothetical protein